MEYKTKTLKDVTLIIVMASAVTLVDIAMH